MTGFVNINKAAGVSSAREVAIIKRLTHAPCGHMGTLDPMAEGVLPIGIGNACRLFDYFLNKRKTYLADFVFGVDYDTLDTTGALIKSGGRIPSAEELEKICPETCGEVMQIPPAYSAKNVGGRRAYDLARAGEKLNLPPKKVDIYSVELIKKVSDGVFRFRIECGGGTYIRSIARDMAEKAGTHAAMCALVREKSGIFDISKSVKTENLTEENIAEYIIPTDSVLPFDCVYAGGNLAKRLFNGLSAECENKDGLYKIYNDGVFYGIAEVNGGIIRIKTKLC